MVNYELIDDTLEWNNQIVKNTNFSPYQLFEWGEYKKSKGWKAVRIKSNDNGEIGYLQITYKIKFNIFAGWAIGSISGKIPAFNKKSLISFIRDHFRVKYIFIKSSFTNILDFNDSIELYVSGWMKSKKKINSDYTIVVNLKKNINELVKNCSSNWRKNLKRGQKCNENYNVALLKEYDENKIFELFERFKDIKNIDLPKLEDLRLIKHYMGNRIIIASSSIDGNLAGLRAFLFLGNKAIDFWAATDATGRENYTSFFLLFKLFEKAKEIGISSYDMSGIDPIKNQNVFLFKNGLRGDIVEKLGEWELSNSIITSFMINKLYV